MVGGYHYFCWSNPPFLLEDTTIFVGGYNPFLLEDTEDTTIV